MRRKRWGISYYVIFEPYVEAFVPAVARLAGNQALVGYSSAVRDPAVAAGHKVRQIEAW